VSKPTNEEQIYELMELI